MAREVDGIIFSRCFDPELDGRKRMRGRKLARAYGHRRGSALVQRSLQGAQHIGHTVSHYTTPRVIHSNSHARY